MSPVSLDKQSTITIGLGLLIAVGVWTAASVWTKTTVQQTAIIQRLDKLEEALVIAASDRFRRNDMILWTTELAEKNKDVWVPSVENGKLLRITPTPND